MDASPTLTAGMLLRRLRKKRKLTLMEVQELTGVSTAALSRMERDEREVTRADCTALAIGYRLGPYESYMLFAACGFLPYLPSAFAPAEEAGQQAALAHAHRLLRDLKYPAAALDGAGYLLAWNGPLEVLQPPLRGLEAGARAHLLDDLFAPAVRKRMGAGWRAYATAALRHFAGRSLMVALDGAFLGAIAELTQRHGDDFAQLWREVTQQPAAATRADGEADGGAAEAGVAADGEAAKDGARVGARVGGGAGASLELIDLAHVRELVTQRGSIRCLATSVALDGGLPVRGGQSGPVELQILLPLDTRSIQRYQRLVHAAVLGTLHEAPPPPPPPPPPPEPEPEPIVPLPFGPSGFGPLALEGPPLAWPPHVPPPFGLYLALAPFAPEPEPELPPFAPDDEPPPPTQEHAPEPPPFAPDDEPPTPVLGHEPEPPPPAQEHAPEPPVLELDHAAEPPTPAPDDEPPTPA